MQTKPIRGLTGGDITQATLQTTLDQLNIDKKIADLSYAEKRLIIIISLTKQLNASIGDMGRTIEQPANQTRVLNSQWERLTRAIGNLFLPILAKVLPYLNAILMVLTDIVNLVAGFIANLFGFDIEDFDVASGVADSVLDLSENIDDVSGALDNATNSAKNLKKEMTGLRGFDKLNNLTTPKDTGSTGTSGGAGGGLGISPDIMKAFDDAFANYNAKLKDIKMKATEIAEKIRDWLGFTDGSYKNLKLIGAVLGTIVGLSLIKKAKDLVKIIGTSGLFKALTKLLKPIKELGLKGGLAKIFADAIAKAKVILPIIGKVATVIGSLVAIIGGSVGLYQSMKKLILGTKDSNKEWGKYALSMTSVIGGATALGVLIGGPLGGAIGAVTGLVIGGISAWAGYNKAMTEIAKSKVFGSLKVSTEEWMNVLKNSTTEITDFGSKMDGLRKSLESHGEAFETATSSLELFSYKYGVLGQKISEEDAPKILDAIQTMGDESISIIDETTNANVELWASTFKDMSILTEDEEKNILNSMIQYGENQKKEIANAQNNISKTYENGIKTRGYLTAEEYKYIAEQLEKIRQLTETEMTRNQANIEYYKTKFADANLKLDEDSYKNFSKALKGHEKEQQEIIEKNYEERLRSAESYHKTANFKEEEYQAMLKYANDQRVKDETKLRTELKEIKGKVYEDLANHYASLTNKTDKESKNQKKLIENVFKGINVDSKDIINKFATVGQNAGKTCAENIGKGFNSKKLNLSYDISEIAGGQGSVKQAGGFKASWAYAKGGLPPVGQLFVANERGPELVGHIGGQSFVANQNQMMDLLDKKIGNMQQSNQPQTFNIYVGGEKVTSVVYKGLKDMAKTNGKPIEIRA